jgi:hypothetical protein
MITAVLYGAVVARAWAQAPRPVTLDIEWENSVGYLDDLSDPSKLVTSPGIPALNLRNFMRFIAIADIISVNGKPAKGTWVLGGRLVQIFRSPMPGQAIGDLAVRGSMADIHLEILDNDGAPVGTIMTSGFTGGNSPPGLPGFCNLAVIGGTGAFQGATGTVASPNFSTRPTSMAEDPASRRINGGTRGHFFAYLTSTASPEIVSTASGPAVFHTDFSPVTVARPARTGETLILMTMGLGPTRPGLTPGTPFPQSPLQEVNSPLDVTVNGKAADVLNKFGWPGTTDRYRLDIRVPDGTAPGMAALQLTAAFIPGPTVSIPVQ